MDNEILEILREFKLEFKSLNDKFEGLENKFEGLDNKFEDLDNKIEGLDNKLEGLENKFEGLDNKLEGLENKFEGLDNKLEGLENKFEGLDNKLEGLNNKIDRHTIMLEELNKKVEIVSEVQTAHKEQNDRGIEKVLNEQRNTNTLLASSLKSVSDDVLEVKIEMKELNGKFDKVEKVTMQNTYDVAYLKTVK